MKKDAPGRRRPGTIRFGGLLVAAVLALLVITAFVVRLPLVSYNLPVAANVDERPGYAILERFAGGDLDPRFFHYPTFYYYATHFVCRVAGGAGDLLRTARVLNLAFACALGIVVFFLTRRLFGSGGAGAAAAALVLFSPTIVDNAGYVITDVLMALLAMAALLAFHAFWAGGRARWWVAGVVLAGLAISTKYTAVLLAAWYVLAELTLPPGRVPEAGAPMRGPDGERGIPPGVLAAGGIAIGLAAAAAYLFFPEQRLLEVLRSGGKINSVVDASDLAFLGGMRVRLLVLGVAAALVGVASLRVRPLAERLGRLRLWAALAGMALVFFLGSPYILSDWKRFLYDFGYELKMNEWAGQGRFWTRYPVWLVQNESLVAAALALVGLGAALRQRRRGPLLLALYALLVYASIGAATRGFARYLTPVLPVLFVFAGFGLVAVWRGVRSLPGVGRLAAAVPVLALVAAGLEVAPRISALVARSRARDEMHASYSWILGHSGGRRVRFSGYAPSVELPLAGVAVEEFPREWLETGRILTEVPAGGLFLVDGESQARIGSATAAGVERVFADSSGFGQFVYRLTP